MTPDLFGNRPLPTPLGGPGINPYAAGKKHYGAGRPMPNIGPVSDKLGYAIRDNETAAKKSAIRRRLAVQPQGDPNNIDYLGYMPGGGNY